MISEQIRFLREHRQMTQTELARRLGITRSSVNAWEIGISVPSTQYIVELAKIFQVSTDYLLGVSTSVSLPLSGLTDQDIQMVYRLVDYMREKNSGQ